MSSIAQHAARPEKYHRSIVDYNDEEYDVYSEMIKTMEPLTPVKNGRSWPMFLKILIVLHVFLFAYGAYRLFRSVRSSKRMPKAISFHNFSCVNDFIDGDSGNPVLKSKKTEKQLLYSV